MTVADVEIQPFRQQRLASLVSLISTHPGWSRRELASRFFLSERQVQADLDLIRDRMGMPLVRSRGYRFLRRCSECGREHQ